MGAKVIAYDVAYNPEFEPFLTYTDLDTVLKEADIVSLHTPLFPSTENMIGEKQLKEMKKSAYLINCARGELVDTGALIKALQKRQLAGAALDVYDSEPLAADDPLLQMDNVLLTPHSGYYSDTSNYLVAKLSMDNALYYVNGEYDKVKAIRNGVNA